MEQMARRLAQKEEESSIFGSMKDFKGMKVVDLRDYVFLEDFEDFEESSATTVEEGKKVRCLCNGFYQSNMREKHMLSAERHLIFIAIQFKALELPYICTCGKEVATLNRLTSHFTTSAHRNYVASFNPKVIEIIPPDEDDMLDNVKDEQVLEGMSIPSLSSFFSFIQYLNDFLLGVAYNRKLRLNNKFCQVDEIVLYTVLCSIQFCSGLNRNFRLDRYQQKGLAVDLHYR